MTLLKPAANLQAFAKVGVFGEPGAGKTFTSMRIALGLAKLNNKPVAFFDTETGSDFMIRTCEAAGIELLAHKSRSFVDLVEIIGEAEKTCSVLIIDSVTHVWRELCDSYTEELKRRYNRNTVKLQFQDWAVVKGEWAVYTDKFINSKLHIIACGRGGFNYDYDYNDDGTKDLVKTGTKMKVETEFGYEPSLLIEMERIKPERLELEAIKDMDLSDKDKRKRKQAIQTKIGSSWIHRAHILKDRTDTINGKVFDFPKYEDFQPHFEYLNIGGDHLGVDTSSTSDSLFEDDGPVMGRAAQDKLRTIALDEIKGQLQKIYPGSTTGEKAIKGHILEMVFSTRAWSKVEGMGHDYLTKEALHVKRLVDEITSQLNTDDYQDKDKVSGVWNMLRDEWAAVNEDIPI
jgi:hypothetical protein